MPSYDSSRSRLRLADRHIGVLGYLAEGAQVPQELAPSLTELREAGLVGPAGELSALLAELVATLAAPALVVQVEVTGEHGQLDHGLVVGDRAVIGYEGWPGEEECEYVQVEPTMLVWALARMVDLRSRESAPGPVTRVETTMGVLDAAFTALAGLGGEDATDPADVRDRTRKTLVDAGGPPEPVLSQLADLVLSLNASWRISVAWHAEPPADQDVPAGLVRGLAVWDCGAQGYWHRELPAEPIQSGDVDARTELHLVKATAGELWEKIADLLPDQLPGDRARGRGAAAAPPAAGR